MQVGIRQVLFQAFAIKKAILLPLAFGLVVLLTAFLLSVQMMYLRQEDDTLTRLRQEVAHELTARQRDVAQYAEGMLQVLARMAEAQRAFQQRDRAVLLQLTQPLFEHFRDHLDITHLYFITPELEVMLRAHLPERHGDVLNRPTLLKAKESGATVAGLELGTLGTLTLRVVMPWRDDAGRLLGYLELGQEFVTLLRGMRLPTGLELHAFLDKRLLSATAWREGMAMMNRHAQWERFEDWAWAGNNPPTAIPPDPRVIDQDVGMNWRRMVVELLFDDPHQHYFDLPLQEIGGRQVGRLSSVIDATSLRDSTQLHVRIVAPTLVLVGLGLLFFYFGLVSRVENRLRGSAEQLQISEERLREIQESALDGIVVLSREGRVVECNPAAAILFQWSRTELLGQLAWDTILPHDYRERHQRLLSGVFWTGRRGERAELKGRRADGQEVEVELSIATVNGGAEPLVTLFCRDIGERKLMLRRLNDSLTAAQEASAAKSSFLATVSHEIRTPMNAILGMAELLAESPMNEEQTRYVATFQRAGETLQAIISDILDLSKIEAGRLMLEVRPLRLDQLVAETSDLFLGIAHDKGLTLTWQVVPAVAERRLGDSVRIRQLLFNFLGNAIKFTQHGSVTVEVYPTPGERGPQWVRLQVSDTGIGVPAEKQEAIFLPFVQADSSTTRRFGGTGLGLAICQRLVELMGGVIGVVSQPEGGSRFHCDLPLPCHIGDETVAAAGQCVPEPTAACPPLRILVADDDPSNRMLVRAFLKHSHHSLELVEDGQQALDRLRADPFDLVLMDMQMPVMDGFTAVRLYRDWEAEQPRKAPTPIVAVTAFAADEDRLKVLAVGCTGHLAKPVRKLELLQTIARHACAS